LDDERRQLKKEKERARKERLKAEGKLLTAAQKQEKMRQQQMLAMREAEGRCCYSQWNQLGCSNVNRKFCGLF